MNHPQATCNDQQLRLLLADQLPESARTAVEDHLAQCEACRRTLESLAGDASWWSEVESCYRVNSQRLGQTDSGSVAPTDDADLTDDSFTADFAVGFLEPCDQPEAIGRLGEYEIQSVIGRGGMGIVLKGFHRELGRYVAVKAMAPHLASSGAARQRFIREARAAAAIVHPNVMPIHSVCTTARLPYLVMPYVACESLQQRIDRQGPLELKETLRIGMQVSAGLAAAHAQGLVHRDVKPANILLEMGVDRVMLTDFGLARAADDGSLTRTGVVTGTPQYMSPEQARGDQIDTRSDLFSLGSVLYAMCTGRPPFRAETTLGVLRRICDTLPRPIREVSADVPAWLERIVQRLHGRTPAERWQTSNEVAELLEQCLAHVQQPTAAALPESLRVVEPVEPPRSRRIATATAATATAVLLLVAAWFAFGRPWTTNDAKSMSTSPAARELTDDSVTELVDQTRDDLDQLERLARSFWDEPATVDSPKLPNSQEDN